MGEASEEDAAGAALDGDDACIGRAGMAGAPAGGPVPTVLQEADAHADKS